MDYQPEVGDMKMRSLREQAEAILAARGNRDLDTVERVCVFVRIRDWRLRKSCPVKYVGDPLGLYDSTGQSGISGW